MKKIYLLQTAIADYRDNFIHDVSHDLGNDFYIFCGDYYFEKSTRTSEYIKGRLNSRLIRNIFLFNNKICIQVVPFFKFMKADVVYLELNPRLISNWIILFFRRIRNKPTVLWGHVWSRDGAKSKTEKLRNVMRKFSDRVLYYTESQKEEYIERYPAQHINNVFVAPNALYKKTDMRISDAKGNNFIYVGRLVKSKKVELLVRAFSKFLKEHPCSAILDIIGDGPEKEKLEYLVEELALNDRVKFHGHIADMDKLYNLYKNSICSVSPGYVGLSITQSFSFGIPMLVSKDEHHSPEIEALEVGKNGVFFDSDSIDSLGCKLNEFYGKRDYWFTRREEICNNCKATYSVEAMADGFILAGR